MKRVLMRPQVAENLEIEGWEFFRYDDDPDMPEKASAAMTMLDAASKDSDLDDDGDFVTSIQGVGDRILFMNWGGEDDRKLACYYINPEFYNGKE